MKQLCKVVMLSTEKASELFIGNNNQLFIGIALPSTSKQINQHLYLTSDEEIKEGDWYLDTNDNIIKANKKNIEFNNPQIGWDKIIATTDKSLLQDFNKEGDGGYTIMPQIPESFIKAYVEAKGEIKEVLVEYQEYANNNKVDSKESYQFYLKNNANFEYKAKIRPDNTVIISASKTYTREDMISFASKVLQDINSNSLVYQYEDESGHVTINQEEFNKYIQNNLK